jgi:hypothetical protein
MRLASITERAQAAPFDNAAHSHCVLAGSITLILRLLNQQQVARMYNVFGRWIFVFKVLFSCFYCNNAISNVAKHYP